MGTFTGIRRIIRSGFINFWRNATVSVAAILVFTIALFIIGSLVFGRAVFNASLTELKDKVDVVVSFKIDALDADIIQIQKKVASLPEVKEARYVSRDEVLAEFKGKHANDALILQSLEELGGDNPFGAELAIKAHDPEEYQVIVRYLEDESIISSQGQNSVVDKINYEDNKSAIDSFTQFTAMLTRIGFLISLFTIGTAVLVTFNTIQLAIYTAREEISVMRLVGASNSYIRGPFVIEGVIYGVLATCLTLMSFYFITQWISTETHDFFATINLFEYYKKNFFEVASIVFGSGLLLGVISSTLAIRRYLKV